MELLNVQQHLQLQYEISSAFEAPMILQIEIVKKFLGQLLPINNIIKMMKKQYEAKVLYCKNYLGEVIVEVR